MTERHRKSFLAKLGPGLITGAADDDPSGIGTYSQVGAQFGYGLSWSLLYSLPLMTVIQDVVGADRIGDGARNRRQSAAALPSADPAGRGRAASLCECDQSRRRPQRDGRGDAIAAGRRELSPTRIGFGLVCVLLETFLSYRRYAAVLKFTTLSLFAYVAVVFAVHVPWGQAIKAVFIPHVEWTAAFATGFVAILGTTISPYLFFWQAAQEIEEEKRSHTKPLYVAPRKAGRGDGADPPGHVYRHELQQCGRDLHRLRRRRDSQRPWHHDDRDGGAGGRGASPGRGSLRFPAVRIRDHRHRIARRARLGRVGRLCCFGSAWTARQP